MIQKSQIIVVFAVVFAAAVLMLACGEPDTPGRSRAIEAQLAGEGIDFPTGIVMVENQYQTSFFKRAEEAGLLTMREIPQDYWGSFLQRTQGIGAPVELAATTKLKQIAAAVADPDARKKGRQLLRVKQREAKIENILTDDNYTGPLAAPGETYRLILGTCKLIPTRAAHVVGSAFCDQDERTARFRCVVRYGKFTKTWSVVAYDWGFPNSDDWLTNNVK